MDTNRLSLGDFIRGNAVDEGVAAGAMRLAWPILQRAERGRFVRTGEVRYDLESFRAPIEEATGLKVARTRMLFQRNVFAAKSGETRYGDLVDYDGSVAAALFRAHYDGLRKRFDARHGPDRYEKVRDALWDIVRRDVARPLGFQFWEDPGETPISSAGEALATTLHYLLAAAVIGDGGTVGKLSGLVKLMGKAIPIGAIEKEPGTWLLVAPSE